MNLLLLLVACGLHSGRIDEALALPAADLTDEGAPKLWAQAHPMLALTRSWGLARPEEQTFGDAQCPARSEAGGVTTYHGGCDDKDGNRWVGTLTVTSEVVRADGFGSEISKNLFGRCYLRTWSESRREPVISNDAGVPEAMLFDVRLSRSVSCEPFLDAAKEVWAAETRIHMDLASSGGRLSSTGTFADRHGGVVDAQTAGMYLDACQNEPDGGQTVVHSAGHALLYAYDGVGADGACTDDQGRVPVSLDGVSVGEVDFPKCAAVDGAAGLFAITSALGFAARRRRPGEVG